MLVFKSVLLTICKYHGYLEMGWGRLSHHATHTKIVRLVVSVVSCESMWAGTGRIMKPLMNEMT